jgi:hypothetical protein
MSLAKRYWQSAFINEIVSLHFLHFYSTQKYTHSTNATGKRSWQSAFINEIVILHFYSTLKNLLIQDMPLAKRYQPACIHK